MKDENRETDGPNENVAALLSHLKPDSLAYKLVSEASLAEPGKSKEVVISQLQRRVKALCIGFSDAKVKVD